MIGIVGKDSFGGALDDIAAKKTIQERQIVVRRFASPDQYKQPCHILFVSRSLPQDQQAALIRNTQGAAMLVVGETPGFAESGGGANFVVEEGQVRFEINVATARQSRLRMDAKLLNLGKPVGRARAARFQLKVCRRAVASLGARHDVAVRCGILLLHEELTCFPFAAGRSRPS